MEDLLLSGNGLRLLLLLHLLRLLLVHHHVIGQSLGLPSLLEDILKQLAVNEGNLVPHASEELELLRLLISISDLGLDDDT